MRLLLEEGVVNVVIESLGSEQEDNVGIDHMEIDRQDDWSEDEDRAAYTHERVSSLSPEHLMEPQTLPILLKEMSCNRSSTYCHKVITVVGSVMFGSQAKG